MSIVNKGSNFADFFRFRRHKYARTQRTLRAKFDINRFKQVQKTDVLKRPDLVLEDCLK